MYITPYQKKQLTTVLLLVLGIPLTLFAIYKGTQWFTSAGTDTQPHNVILANVTTNSITVTWTTETEVSGSVIPVLSGTEQNPSIDKRGTGKYSTHYVELKSLEPGSTYDFKILSGEDTYTDTGGNDFEFTTANIGTETPTPTPVHGDLAGSNSDDVIIYIFPKDKTTYPVATVPSSSGNWLVDLSALRTVSDKSMYTVTDSTNLVVIGASGVDNGGFVEGDYGTVFDSSGKLTETLIAEGNPYDTYLSDSSKLVAKEVVETPIQDPIENDDDEDIYVPPTTQPDEEVVDDFDRDYELTSDLLWTNMVSTSGEISSTPDIYGEDSVMVTNLTDVSFTVLWYSELEETGYVMYGTSALDMPDKARDERDGISTQGEYYLHSIEVTQLEPETNYYFEIYSNDEAYEYEGEVTTFATQSSPPAFETIAGEMDVDDYNSAVVIAMIEDSDESGSSGESYPISTLIDSEGSWILTIGGVRDEDGEYYDKSDQDIITFSPKYFSDPSDTQLTLGEATSNEVTLSASSSSNTTTFKKISRLADYGILVD